MGMVVIKPLIRIYTRILRIPIVGCKAITHQSQVLTLAHIILIRRCAHGLPEVKFGMPKNI